VRTILALLILVVPTIAIADVQWHKFSASDKDPAKLSIGKVSAVIETRKEKDGFFHEDNLIMTVQIPDQKPDQYWFSSSYGYGEIAIE